MTLVWSVVVVIVLVFGGFLTPWEAIIRLLKNAGPAEDATLIAFLAGYTFPLTLATVGLVFGKLAGWFEDIEPRYVGLIIATALFGAGLLAAGLGLGLLPDYSLSQTRGPLYVAIPLFVMQGYINAYGWPLVVCSVAIGSAAALQIRQSLVAAGAKS